MPGFLHQVLGPELRSTQQALFHRSHLSSPRCLAFNAYFQMARVERIHTAVWDYLVNIQTCDYSGAWESHAVQPGRPKRLPGGGKIWVGSPTALLLERCSKCYLLTEYSWNHHSREMLIIPSYWSEEGAREHHATNPVTCKRDEAANTCVLHHVPSWIQRHLLGLLVPSPLINLTLSYLSITWQVKPTNL